MNLQHIFDKHKCDKGTSLHRYDRLYETVFAPFNKRHRPFTMLEVGIFKGAALGAWIEFLPHVKLSAIDVFTRVIPNDIDILKHERISWAKQDSMGPITSEFRKITKAGFDIIIDDGLHTHDSQRLTFQNLFPFLKEGGSYFIEDVWPYDIMTREEKHHTWMEKNKDKYSYKQFGALLESLSKYTVTRHDLRKGFQPDTYIIQITK